MKSSIQSDQKNHSSGHVSSHDTKSRTLRGFLAHHNPTLLRMTTVFPFTLFPDHLKIDMQKISIVYHDFFWSRRDQTLNIDDVLSVSVEAGPLFATLVITTKFFTQKPLRIRYLHKSDALRARRVINGLIIVYKQDIYIKETDPDQIIKMLEKVGQVG